MALLECCFWFSNRVTRRITWPRPVEKFSAIGFPFPSLAVMFVFIFSNYSLHSHQLKAIDNKQNLHPLDLYRDNKMEANRTLSKQYFSKFEEWVIQGKRNCLVVFQSFGSHSQESALFQLRQLTRMAYLGMLKNTDINIESSSQGNHDCILTFQPNHHETEYCYKQNKVTLFRTSHLQLMSR